MFTIQGAATQGPPRPGSFGPGFYVTPSLAAARTWAVQRATEARAEAKQVTGTCISVYDFNEQILTNGPYAVKQFSLADGDWVRFIIDNRHTSVLAHDFDIVAGPIPSAELLTAIDNYENGIADYSLITKALGKQQPLQQIAFLSEYAVYTLTFSEAIEVDLC